MRTICLLLLLSATGCVRTSADADTEAQAYAAVCAANVALSHGGNTPETPIVIPDAPEQQPPDPVDPVKTVKAWYRCDKCGRVGWKEFPEAHPAPIQPCPDPTCGGLMKLYETP